MSKAEARVPNIHDYRRDQVGVFSLRSEKSCSPAHGSRAEASLHRDAKETHLKTRGQCRDVMAGRAEPRIARSKK